MDTVSCFLLKYFRMYNLFSFLSCNLPISVVGYSYQMIRSILMFFRHKQTLPELKLYHDNKMIYQGYLKDVPLKESVILAKSVEFFDDPEPCHIHRSAVRT